MAKRLINILSDGTKSVLGGTSTLFLGATTLLSGAGCLLCLFSVYDETKVISRISYLLEGGIYGVSALIFLDGAIDSARYTSRKIKNLFKGSSNLAGYNAA